MKKTVEQLEKMLEKELELSEQHKKKFEQHKKTAADIKNQIDFQKGKIITQTISPLNMTGDEYARFMKFLKTGRATVMDAVDLALNRKEPEQDADSKET